MQGEFEGIVIDDDYLDDLVDCWHDNTDQEYTITLEDFIIANTGWNDSQYAHWFVTGKIPN